MEADTFGNLGEWGEVLHQLESLKESGKLDDQQGGMARILRYRKNWRLLERVLEYGKEIRRPEEEFLAEVFRAVSDSGLYPEARILALKTWECLACKRPESSRESSGFAEICTLAENCPGPPLLQKALAESVETLRQDDRGNGPAAAGSRK